MIRIAKSPAPAWLDSRAPGETKALVDFHDQDPTGCAEGTKKIPIKSAIYGHDQVRAALRVDQPTKCAFCESEYTHVGFGDVEHYRPKAGWRQKRGDAISKPGYYWLAYNWDNLFLSCTLCNQAFKENLFPLKVQKDRARTHHDDLLQESPLLVKPTEDAGKYISFYGETAIAVNNSLMGKATIECYGLNRSALVEKRLKRLAVVKLLIEARDRLLAECPPPRTHETQSVIDELELSINEAKKSTAEYSSMIKNNVRLT